MLITNTLTNALCVYFAFLWNCGFAEWIDMPQFSDEEKIYRMPSSKHDHFYKFNHRDTADQFPFEYQTTVTKISTKGRKTNNESDDFASHQFGNFGEFESDEHFTEENIFTVNSEKHETKVNEKFVDQQTWQNANEEHLKEPQFSNGTDILQYLPIDILKSVHRTLKSQPTSSEGKMMFLKTFERTLTTEIESRLTQALTSTRQKRGAEHHDHYGYDHHEHSTGFPSIEGALMAISFLTFAVYLIRLVMLLFRNMNNTTSNTTGATVFLGKRKRSVNELDEITAKILDGVKKFSANFQ